MATKESHDQPQQHGDQDDDDELFDTAALDQYDYFRFTISDVNGIARCMSVPRRHVDHCLHDGLAYFAGRPTRTLQGGACD